MKKCPQCDADLIRLDNQTMTTFIRISATEARQVNLHNLSLLRCTGCGEGYFNKTDLERYDEEFNKAKEGLKNG